MVLPLGPTGQSGYRRHIPTREDQGFLRRLPGFPPPRKLHRNLRRLCSNRSREHPRQISRSKGTTDPVPEDRSLSEYDVQRRRRISSLTRPQTSLIRKSEVQRDQEDTCAG